ncbi:hypothetical protein C0Q70_16134 [Pomacea canaliculata]|uniref:G-protein coupled receptors family 1 profile domain-containing protein n=1 Tax=Pomacea canaliculata TaxID=400727 RepID=A0A2T7NNX5_POMCA|nr:hypothetical protein C0Q70_16134 [Pomacea canaliculata]
MPYEILALVSAHCDDCVDEDLFEFSFWLLWINSTLNPVLYPILHRRFREAAASVIAGCRKLDNMCNQMQAPPPCIFTRLFGSMAGDMVSSSDNSSTETPAVMLLSRPPPPSSCGSTPAFSPDYYNTHAQSAGFMSGDMVSSNDNSSTGTPVDSNAAPFSPTATVVVGLLTSLMALLTIVGNGFTLVVFALSRSLRKFGHFFVINLAIADLAIGVLAMPPGIHYLLTGTWQGGHAFCKFWLIWDYVTTAASSLCICVISIDRYSGEMRDQGLSEKRARRVKILTIQSPRQLSARGSKISSGSQEDITTNDVVDLTSEVKGHTQSFVDDTGDAEDATTKLNSSRAQPGSMASSADRRSVKSSGLPMLLPRCRARKDIRVALSLFVLVLVFTICWIPYEIIALVMVGCHDCVNKDLYAFSSWLLWFNSTINPVLYLILHTRFREAAAIVIAGCWECESCHS